MMTIDSVNPTGLYSFGRHGTIDVNNIGLTILNGINKDKLNSSNGSGKTSLFNSITTILYDDSPLGEGGDTVVNESLGKCCGKVQFSIDTIKWRVIYTRKWRKTDGVPDQTYEEPSDILASGEKYSGTDVYLERWDGLKWVDERPSAKVGAARLDLKATRSKIVDVIGMTYDQFISVSYLAQQQSLKFINGKHKDRMQIIADISDLSIWDERKENVKASIKAKESDLGYIGAQIDGANQTAKMLSAPSDSDRITLVQSKQDKLDKINSTESAINSQSVLISTELLDKTTIEALVAAEQSCLRALSKQLDTISAEANVLSVKYANDCATARRRGVGQEYEQLKMDASGKRGYVIARRHDIEQLLPASGRCPKCRSVVTAEHISRHKELLLLEISEIETQIQELEDKAKLLYEEWEQSMLADLKLLESAMLLSKSEIDLKKIACLDEQTEHGLALSKHIESANNADSKILSMRNELHRLSTAKSQLTVDIGHIDAQIRDFDRVKLEWDKYNQTISDAKIKYSILEDEIKYLNVVERMFGDRGIKAHKLSSVISQLNFAIQQNLDIISDRSIFVWITPFREKKSDGDIVADIQIMVKDGSKSKVPFSLYSGGEKQQIILAIIGAFWHVASLQGSGVNLLCLDEVFGPVDSQNAQGIIRYLDAMRLRGKSSILVVMHSQEIKDQIDFNNEWTVEKVNGISTLIQYK